RTGRSRGRGRMASSSAVPTRSSELYIRAILSTTGELPVKSGRQNSPGDLEVTGNTLESVVPIRREALHEDCDSYRDRSRAGRLRVRHVLATTRRADVRR